MSDGVGVAKTNDAVLAKVLDGLQIALQPVIDLASGAVFAYEALARFPSQTTQRVDEVIAWAHATGFGPALEAACLRAALTRRAELPDAVALTVNLSPDVVDHPDVASSWDDDLDGVVVEVTEHRASRVVTLHDELDRLRRRGAAIAIDDVGTEHANMWRLATMRPDYVKIDRTIVRGVCASTAQQAVLEAYAAFSRRIRAHVIAEGLETLDDLTAMADFDVGYGQGWIIGAPADRPEPVSEQIVATCQLSRSHVLQRRGVSTGKAAGTETMNAVTTALLSATGLTGIREAAKQAAARIGIDVIGVSVLGVDGTLRELTSTMHGVDPVPYPVSDYPPTQVAFQTGNTVEVHIADAEADAAETHVLREHGYASLLMIPFAINGAPIGLLEFAHRTHRRWTAMDIAHGRGLAAQIGQALMPIIV